MRNASAAVMVILTVTTLLADERKFALALIRWRRDRSLGSLLHLATSGFFLAEDVAALGFPQDSR